MSDGKFPAPSFDGMLTVSQTAKLCGVTPWHVNRWVVRGRLAAYRPYGSTLIVLHAKDVEKFRLDYHGELGP